MILRYEMLPTTWFCLSSLMIIALFFRFDRFWSVRNLDLVGLILLTPGLLWIGEGYSSGQSTPFLIGYLFLFAVQLGLVFRLVLDPLMTRRPLLEPNLSPSAMTFTAAALLIFLIAGLFVGRGDLSRLGGMVRFDQIMTLHDAAALRPAPSSVKNAGFPPFQRFAAQSDMALAPRLSSEASASDSRLAANSGNGGATADSASIAAMKARLEAVQSKFWPNFFAMAAAISATIAIVGGQFYIGYRHFGNFQTGVAAVVLYLLLPYASQMPGRLDHIVPGALLLWALAMYRLPLLSGSLIGLASALSFSPLFLLPLWGSFYWRKGLLRFVSAFAGVWLLLGFLLLFFPAGDGEGYFSQLGRMAGMTSLSLDQAQGFWTQETHPYRIPVVAVFAILSLGFTLWPAHKHLGTLMSCSALLMMTTQFWLSHQGGLYMAWYLPLLVVTILRPNLEDRIAWNMVSGIGRGGSLARGEADADREEA